MSTATAERKASKHEPSVSKLHGGLPHDERMEQSVLGSLLLWPSKIDDVLLVLDAHDFHDLKHGMIFKAVVALHGENKPVEPTTVAERLHSLNQLESCKGAEYLIDLMAVEPHGAHATYYAGIVAEKSHRRQLILAGQDAITFGHDEILPIDEAVGRAETRLIAVLERLAGKASVSIDSVLLDVMARLEGKKESGLKTGFHGFDEITRGLLPGNLIVIAARPSMGKTAFAVNIAERVARRGTPVGIMSLEQSVNELLDRMICGTSKLSMNQIREPKNLTEAQVDGVLKAAQELSALPISYDDSPASIITLEASARIMRRRDKIELLVVDYLQYIAPEDRRAPREQQVADITRRLKRLGKTLGIPVIVLAQLNREVEKLNDKRPKLSHLRESGAIEQDADIIAFVHRENEKALLIVAKHRNGATGDIEMRFEEKYMQFQDAAADHVASREPVFSRTPYSDPYDSDFSRFNS